MPIHEFDTWHRELDLPVYVSNHPTYTKVHDELIQELMEACSIVRTYYHSYDRLRFGLCYHGITIIPNESLPHLYEIVIESQSFIHAEELNDLATLILSAQREGKNVVHFGM